jgi:hypothetical protein
MLAKEQVKELCGGSVLLAMEKGDAQLVMERVITTPIKK